jgi:HK97 family phage major capsid protein
MGVHMDPRRVRGIAAVRADGSSPAAIIAQLQTAFEEFKAENDARLKDLTKGQEDVVRNEKVDRINASIGELETSLAETNRMLAAMRVGGAGGVDLDPAKAEHAQAFDRWFRRGREPEAGMRELEVKAKLATDSDPDGGYVVPEQMASTIDRVLGTVSAMRSAASVMTISAPVYKKLVSVGGAASGWVGERQSRPETATPTLRELVFNLMELYANPAATQTALDDGAVDLAAWLADEVAIEFAEQEGAAFITGDGHNKPRGILSYDFVANASWEWGKVGYTPSGVAAALTNASNNGTDALITLYHSLKAGLRPGAVFMMNDITAGVVRTFKDGQGAYLYAPPNAESEMPTLFRKPVMIDENMPSVAADAFPIVFGNLTRGYLIVEKQGVRVLRDPFTNKPNVHFYTTKRVGGGISHFQAVKALKVATS